MELLFSSQVALEYSVPIAMQEWRWVGGQKQICFWKGRINKQEKDKLFLWIVE